ncbi:MAG: PASTA domain-containing protein [Phycisphaerae bacterium]|nr:PASTA domain-containing protein [Phycisphaerae bacterium]
MNPHVSLLRAAMSIVLLGVALPAFAQPASSVPAEATNPPVGTAAPAASGSVAVCHWGPIWYIRGRSSYDDVTMIKGGADGSAVLLIQHADEQHLCADPAATDRSIWVLVEGRYLYLGTSDSDAHYITDRPGWATFSHRPGVIDSKPFPVNHRELSEHLRDIYERTEWTARPILHVPFLTGEGWPAVSLDPQDPTVEVKAASYSQVKEILTDMNLTLKATGPRTGFVTAQQPAPGTRLVKGAPVYVTFADAAKAPSPIARPQGDTPASAIEVASNGGTETAEITLDHSDAQSGQSCGSDRRRDIFWRLPVAARGRQVSIEQTDHSPVTFFAWHQAETGNPPTPSGILQSIGCDGAEDCCNTGPKAHLEFRCPETGFAYVMVEPVYGGQAEVQFKISWVPAEEETAASAKP